MVLIEKVSAILAIVIGWCGDVISAMVGEAGELAELAPLWLVGVAVSALLLGVKVLRTFSWGG